MLTALKILIGNTFLDKQYILKKQSIFNEMLHVIIIVNQ